ncbi:hypothetical protein AA0472_2654 [Acetobacter estunensis NRIC 0472]|nr:hypothetical protein AA0472_2654 [Acetobacter estunensis NRIC 0472]
MMDSFGRQSLKRLGALCKRTDPNSYDDVGCTDGVAVFECDIKACACPNEVRHLHQFKFGHMLALEVFSVIRKYLRLNRDADRRVRIAMFCAEPVQCAGSGGIEEVESEAFGLEW